MSFSLFKINKKMDSVSCIYSFCSSTVMHLGIPNSINNETRCFVLFDFCNSSIEKNGIMISRIDMSPTKDLTPRLGIYRCSTYIYNVLECPVYEYFSRSNSDWS